MFDYWLKLSYIRLTKGTNKNDNDMMTPTIINAFKKLSPAAVVTTTKKAHGTIVYVNGQTAYNNDDRGMKSDMRLKALWRALNASKTI